MRSNTARKLPSHPQTSQVSDPGQAGRAHESYPSSLVPAQHTQCLSSSRVSQLCKPHPRLQAVCATIICPRSDILAKLTQCVSGYSLRHAHGITDAHNACMACHGCDSVSTQVHVCTSVGCITHNRGIKATQDAPHKRHSCKVCADNLSLTRYTGRQHQTCE